MHSGGTVLVDGKLGHLVLFCGRERQGGKGTRIWDWGQSGVRPLHLSVGAWAISAPAPSLSP